MPSKQIPDSGISNQQIESDFGRFSSDFIEYYVYDLDGNYIVSKINQIKDELKEYYILCKGNIYMNNITISRTITILRQFLKTIKYTLTSKERYINSKKYLFYSIISISLKSLITL